MVDSGIDDEKKVVLIKQYPCCQRWYRQRQRLQQRARLQRLCLQYCNNNQVQQQKQPKKCTSSTYDLSYYCWIMLMMLLTTIIILIPQDEQQQQQQQETSSQHFFCTAFVVLPQFQQRRQSHEIVRISSSSNNDDNHSNDRDIIVTTTTTKSTTATNNNAAKISRNKNSPNERYNNNNNYRNGNKKSFNGSNSNRKAGGNTNRANAGGGGGGGGGSNVNQNDRQLNQLLVKAMSANEVLYILQHHTKLQHNKSGNTINNVNHSTALHRLAKHAVSTTTSNSNTISTSSSSSSSNTNNNYKYNRAQILSDPRFALLMTCIGENMSTTIHVQQIQYQKCFFQTRELSNIGWAIAKLKLSPPLSVMSSIIQQQEYDKRRDDDEYYDTLLQITSERLVETTTAIRNAVIQVAMERTRNNMETNMNGSDDSIIGADVWIPLLSQLAGQILDAIGLIAMIMDTLSNRSVEQQHGMNNVINSVNTRKDIPTPKTFQMQEWSNLLWAWATAGRADPIVFGLVVRNMIQQQQKERYNDNNDDSSSIIQPQEWTNSIWAFATAQCYENHIDLLEYVAELMTSQSGFVDTFKSQELSNTVWGVATLLSNKKLQQLNTEIVNQSSSNAVTDREQTAALTILRHVGRSVVRRNAEGFRTQELSNTAWAAATLGFGIRQGQDTSMMNNYLILQSNTPEADTKLMVDMIYAIADSAMKQLSRFWSQELNNLAWALARLLSDNNNLSSVSTTAFEDRISMLLRGIALQLAEPRRSLNAQDIGTTLWSFATLGFCDKELYRNIAVRLTPEQAHRSKPQELSNTIWAFATAEMEIGEIDIFDTSLVPTSQRQNPPRDPITACFGVAARELMRRPYSFKPQEIKDVLWSFSKVGLRYPELFKFVAEHLVGSAEESRGLDDFSTQGLGNMAWAYARQAQLSEMVSDRLNLNSGNGRMSTYKAIYFDVGEHLLLKLFSSIAETNIRVYDKLGRGKPQDISNTAWAFAALGLKDGRYMDAARDALIDRLMRYAKGERNSLTSFKGQELANLLWAMATLNVPAGNCWTAVMAFLRTICANQAGNFSASTISKHFKRQELASMAWACSVFGNYPEELMEFLYVGLFGNENDAKSMEKIYNDSGLQMQAIMTLVYVQTEIDKRGCCQSLSLPANFPDGWSETDSTIAKEDHITELSLGLNLSTSKIQRAVSAAFSRIGFDHVEEHTITMKEMFELHGVRVPAKSIEVLSIDIANIHDRIAIEVDGPSHFITRTDDYWEGKLSSGGYSKVVNGKLEYQFGWTGERQEMNGPTVLKERLLTSFSWKVLHLPFWEWYALAGDPTAEEKYCQELLNK